MRSTLGRRSGALPPPPPGRASKEGIRFSAQGDIDTGDVTLKPGRASHAFPFPLVRAVSSTPTSVGARPRRGASVAELPEITAVYRLHRPVPSLAALRRSDRGGQEGPTQFAAHGEWRSSGSKRRTAATSLAGNVPTPGVPDGSTSSGSGGGANRSLRRALAILEQRHVELERHYRQQRQQQALLEAALIGRPATVKTRLQGVVELGGFCLLAVISTHPVCKGVFIAAAIQSFFAPETPRTQASPRSSVAALKRRRDPLPPPRPEDNYEITEQADSEDDEELVMRSPKRLREAKHVPEWCRSYLQDFDKQRGMDPDGIFGSTLPPCLLHKIFPESLYQRFRRSMPDRRRGSSGEWSNDRPKRHEVEAYKIEMGQCPSA